MWIAADDPVSTQSSGEALASSVEALILLGQLLLIVGKPECISHNLSITGRVEVSGSRFSEIHDYVQSLQRLGSSHGVIDVRRSGLG